MSNLVGKVLSYGVLELVNKGIPFLLLPMLTRWLTPSEFGFVVVVQMIWQVLTIFIQFGAQGRISVSYVKEDKAVYTEKRKVLISNIVLCGSILSGFTLVLSFIISYAAWWSVVPLSSAASAILGLYLAECQAAKNVVSYAWVQLPLMLLNVLLSLVLVYCIGADGRIAGILFPSLILCAYIFVFTNWGAIFQGELSLSYKAAWENRGVFIHQVAGWARYSIDKYVIALYLSTAALGIYNASFQLAFIASVAVTVLNRAVSPYVLERLSKGKSTKKLFCVQIIASALIASGVYAFVYLLGGVILGPDYEVDYFVIQVLLVAFFVQGTYHAFSIYFYYFEKTMNLGGISAVCAVVSAGLALVAVPVFGIHGAAASTLISMAVMLCLVVVVGWRKGLLPWRQ